jgi:hypothetical protein
MQEEEINREGIRRETEERQETNRKEDKERLKQLIKPISEDVKKIKEIFFKKCEERANKLGADISNLVRKNQLSFVELNNKLQSVEEVKCQSRFGGLEVLCWPLVPKFAGSNPAETVGFLGRKNPQHAFLRRGSKAVGTML